MATEIALKLADGREVRVPSGTLVADALRSAGLASEDVLGAKVGGEILDLQTPVRAAGPFLPVRAGTPEGLEILRHSTAHVMAQAVARLFPDVEFAIGPVIEDGFYYDFDTLHVFVPEDLPRIEAEMAKIVAEGQPIRRSEASGKSEAIATLTKTQKAKFKSEIVRELPEDAAVSFYSQGEFTDLCRGPHLPSTARVGKAFRLLSVAGAYWRADQKREQLQRLYGTAWFSEQDLAAYLKRREEAEKRDHRKLGRELELVSFRPEVAPGMPFWHPRGTVIYNALVSYVREKLAARDYVEIRTPHVLSSSLWHRSGHMSHYKDNMFFTTVDENEYAVKPMNCPGSALVYEAGLRSYRDLPLRLAEFGLCHRYEKSGVLAGLTRCRAFVQDDAHIYCAPEQLGDEIGALVALVREVYAEVGFANIRMDLSTRPPSSTGTDEMWRNAEGALESALRRIGAEFRLAPGEGAFYGPKIDFQVSDAIGRSWQLATIQVDFSLPKKFDLVYVAADGVRKRPVVVHRAILGSLERFIGILIEHFAGAFPTWLAPEQVRVIPVSEEKNAPYAREVLAACRAAGLRASADLGSERMNQKIRSAQVLKVPYMFVVGGREAENRTVSVRRRDEGDCGAQPLADAVQAVAAETRSRSLALTIPAQATTAGAKKPAKATT
ncbi:MAG: threonine--tRNA ligase [Planctomycetales bacterium]|nr:threonine--tRNA ligase [Planctomycetales bacterium]